MPENNWVRVTDKDTGHKLSVRESEVPHGNYTVLKQDAVDPVTGDVLPPEYAESSPSKPTAGQPAGSPKENS